MTAVHDGNPPPDFCLTPEQVHKIDTLRLAEKYGHAPEDIEGWSLTWVNAALELYEADNRIAKLKRHHK